MLGGVTVSDRVLARVSCDRVKRLTHSQRRPHIARRHCVVAACRGRRLGGAGCALRTSPRPERRPRRGSREHSGGNMKRLALPDGMLDCGALKAKPRLVHQARGAAT